jgi:hypothetical protein
MLVMTVVTIDIPRLSETDDVLEGKVERYNVEKVRGDDGVAYCEVVLGPDGELGEISDDGATVSDEMIGGVISGVFVTRLLN